MKNNNKKDVRRFDGSYSVGFDTWINAMRPVCELGGIFVQAEGNRVQLYGNRVSLIQQFASQQWYGWVPGNKLCCRFAPEIAKRLFDDDLAQWRKCQKDDNASLPSGDVPVKTSFELRGRITLPDGLMLAVGIKRSQMLFVQPCSGFLEIWIPEAYTAYCLRIASPLTLEHSRSSQLVPANAGVGQGQPI